MIADRLQTTTTETKANQGGTVLDVTVPEGEVWYVGKVVVQCTSGADVGSGEFILRGGKLTKGVDGGSIGRNVLSDLPHTFYLDVTDSRTKYGAAVSDNMGAYVSGGQGVYIGKYSDDFNYSFEANVSVMARRVI